MVEILRISIVEAEIENTYRIDGLEIIVPAVAAYSLVANRESRIEHAAVFEKLLLGFLHLHKKLLAFFILAIDIEHGLAVKLARTKLFTVEIGKVAYDLLPIEHRIKETDEQVLVDLRAEQFLEREISIKVDVSLVEVT